MSNVKGWGLPEGTMDHAVPESLRLREVMWTPVESKIERLRESIRKGAGFSPDEIAWDDPRFSFRKMIEAAGYSIDDLLEANVPSHMGQLFRYGVQHFMFDAYKSVPVIYPDIVTFRPSGNRQEWYAPLFAPELPEEVAPGGPFTDSRIEGLDVTLINKKVGRLLSIEREMFDDDQTGQIVQRAARMGEYVRYKEETDVMGAIEGASYTVAIGNRPAAFAALDQPGLEAADVALANMKDPLGNRMLVSPDYLLVSNADKFVAAKLLNSTLQPSVPGAAGQTASTASSGGVGWTMTINPLQGLYQLAVSRFLTTGKWFLMERRTSIPFQERDPLEIVQENPLSGASFSNDTFKWRVRRRFAVTVLESRYIYRGN